MTSLSPNQIQCPTCGNLNAADSRFCRHCGAALDSKKSENGASDAKAESKIEAHAPMITRLPVAPAPQSDNSQGSDGEERSSPAEIDARRARQLLDRALYLSERGDAAGAILACRQSVALAPTAPGGYSMLGLLLERTNDLPRAITAYEKAVQLAPNSTLERESLERLRERVQGQKGAALFHFDDSELFGENADTLATAVPVSKIVATAAAMVADKEPPLPNIGASAPGLPAAFVQTEAPAAPEAPVETPVPYSVNPELKSSIQTELIAIAPLMEGAHASEERRTRDRDRRQHAVPVMQERRFSSERRTAASPVATAAAGAAPIYIAGLNNGAHKPPSTWNTLWQRPSFYGQALPLVGTTVLCLGFLLWARGFAVSRAVAATSPVTVAQVGEPGPTDPPFQDSTGTATSPNQGGTLPALPPVGSNPASNGGFPISNGASPGAASARTVAPATANGGRIAVTPGSSGNGRGGAVAASGIPRLSSVPRSNPNFPKVIPPAPIPSGSSSNSNGENSGSGGGAPVMPPPNIPQAATVDPPVSVIPAGGSGTSAALNPAGSSRGYVRITQGRIGTSALPQRPAAQAGDDERGAADASRNGQSDQAIQRLSSAINSDSSDAGFRFQQRATLFLERGDYSRAADDFQSAISAYNEQIARGEQVAAARAGVRAARSGLNLALAGKR